MRYVLLKNLFHDSAQQLTDVTDQPPGMSPSAAAIVATSFISKQPDVLVFLL
jgi:hypothetical protein